MASLVRSTQAPVVFTMTSAVKSNTSPVSSSRSWTVLPWTGRRSPLRSPDGDEARGSCWPAPSWLQRPAGLFAVLEYVQGEALRVMDGGVEVGGRIFDAGVQVRQFGQCALAAAELVAGNGAAVAGEES